MFCLCVFLPLLVCAFVVGIAIDVGVVSVGIASGMLSVLSSLLLVV